MYLPEHKPVEVEAWLTRLGQPSADRDYRPGHQRMRELIQPLAIRRPKLRIRIAGTNGKGSTAFMLSAALQACGLRVGLYTSPHIRHFNERIRINGTPVSDTILHALMQHVMPAALKAGASYFEAATALALKCFSDSQVDVEILEAGVGARLDATTAVDADMALITPIGLDHQNWLGDTIESVAAEKAYVAEGCSMVLSAAQSDVVMPILKQRAPELDVIEPDESLSLSMPGNHQFQNAALALHAAKRLIEEGLVDGSMDRLKQAIKSTVVPGRLQKVHYDEATIWLDAAHNRHAVEALLPTLKGLNLDAVFIFTREDRSLADSLPLFASVARRIITDADYPNVAEALQQELALSPDGTFLVLGSFITVAAALEWLGRNY
ncbi:MAG: bifunctional folylpolyglutamate synthase/dihydrofolate synthase [Mariprofundaceae bacterium]|nr:bifunctional folylpolyglutamate synthase/dihydrofolate synthase [Mariprofundaceae bacterium]